MGLKLGKCAVKPHPKTIKFSAVLKAGTLPAPPAKNYWEYLVKSWPMMENDELGCCVVAAAGHMEQNWTAHSGTMITVPDEQIVEAYSAVGGYVPGQPSTDQGLAITDFLSFWQTTGFAGRKILGWVGVDQTNITHVKQAVYLFGALDIGVQLPNSAMDQFNAGMPWDVVADDGGIDGGHCIPIMGQGSQGFACITWGKIQYMTNAFFAKYCDESYGIVTQDWLNAAGRAPNAMNLTALTAALKQISA